MFARARRIVGENNAVKSCLIESLRLISRTAQQVKTRKTFEQAPSEFGLPISIKGFKINTQKLNIGNLTTPDFCLSETLR